MNEVEEYKLRLKKAFEGRIAGIRAFIKRECEECDIEYTDDFDVLLQRMAGHVSDEFFYARAEDKVAIEMLEYAIGIVEVTI